MKELKEHIIVISFPSSSTSFLLLYIIFVDLGIIEGYQDHQTAFCSPKGQWATKMIPLSIQGRTSTSEMSSAVSYIYRVCILFVCGIAQPNWSKIRIIRFSVWRGLVWFCFKKTEPNYKIKSKKKGLWSSLKKYMLFEIIQWWEKSLC